MIKNIINIIKINNSDGHTINILKTKYVTLFVLLPIILGAMIYLAFRDSSLLVFKWIEIIGLESYLKSFRDIALNYSSSIHVCLRYSLPDGIWTYALMTFMLVYWDDCKSLTGIFWILLAPIVSIGGEFAQLFGIIEGTFDWVDILFYLLAIAFSIITLKYIKRRTILYGKSH